MATRDIDDVDDEAIDIHPDLEIEIEIPEKVKQVSGYPAARMPHGIETESRSPFELDGRPTTMRRLQADGSGRLGK